MNKTPIEPSDARDWLTPLLMQDAHGEPDPQQDAAFVAQVMARLDAPPSAHMLPPMPQAHHVLTQGRGLLLGFQLLVVVFLFMSAPAAVQAWLHLGQTPMDLSVWHDPHLWGFALGLGMMVYGTLELLNMPEEAGFIDTNPSPFHA